MSGYEVPQPILNSPFDPPAEHWHIVEGEPPERVMGRRKAVYFYRDPKAKNAQGQIGGVPVELTLVNLVRERLDRWREQGYPGVTRTTLELLQWWNRDGRERRLFFAQREAAETVIFLTEARADFLQGITIPTTSPAKARRPRPIPASSATPVR
jgi:type III restriction enzyme